MSELVWTPLSLNKYWVVWSLKAWQTSDNERVDPYENPAFSSVVAPKVYRCRVANKAGQEVSSSLREKELRRAWRRKA